MLSILETYSYFIQSLLVSLMKFALAQWATGYRLAETSMLKYLVSILWIGYTEEITHSFILL